MDEDIRQTREAIARSMQRMAGCSITGLSDILAMLTHPDILPLTEKLIEQIKEFDRAQEQRQGAQGVAS